VQVVTLKNGMELEISKTQVSDAQEMLCHLNAVGGESDNFLFGENGMKMSLEEEIGFIGGKNAIPGSAMFVGRIDGKIVAETSLFAMEAERAAHIADLGISVRKAYWHMGIGAAMMKTAIEHARKEGRLEVIHLGVRRENVNAIALYKKLGFEEIGVFKRFFKVGDVYYDEILMNLYL
jgi:RimJ/RimL family protein N-acetyltransferase